MDQCPVHAYRCHLRIGTVRFGRPLEIIARDSGDGVGLRYGRTICPCGGWGVKHIVFHRVRNLAGTLCAEIRARGVNNSADGNGFRAIEKHGFEEKNAKGELDRG